MPSPPHSPWAVVGPHPTRAALVRLVVVRYDVAAYPASAA